MSAQVLTTSGMNDCALVGSRKLIQYQFNNLDFFIFVYRWPDDKQKLD